MKKNPCYYILLTLVTIFTGCNTTHDTGYILIKGGTIINTSGNGNNENDLENGYILIKDNRIVEWGPFSDSLQLPPGYELIDAGGKYIIPGLIDGFCVINDQGYADACLQTGVTSIIGVSSLRRGELFENGNPSPNIYKLGEVGDIPQSNEEITSEFESAADNNIRVMLLMYNLTPDQVEMAVKLAHQYGIGTIGELGLTSYKEASEAGVNAFVHTTRYSLDVAPDEMRMAVAKEPFSDDLDSPKWKYYSYLTSLDLENQSYIDHCNVLGNFEGYLMPTLSLMYLDRPGHLNPWNDPVATLINRDSINNPADPLTGNHLYEEDYQEAYTSLALKEDEIDGGYFSHGANYIAGSATDVWGTMPGISLHTELSLLRGIGMNNRQAIAAATSNFSSAFGWDRGAIMEDYYADILILNSNPLKDLKNLRDINRVILNGKTITF